MSRSPERVGDPDLPPAGQEAPRAFAQREPLPVAETRHYQRARRKFKKRATTIGTNRLSQRAQLRVFQEGEPTPEHERPRTRGDCCDGPRPCPFVSCKWHLYLDIQDRTGNIKLNFPELEPEELRESCTLDVADRGGQTLEQIGEFLNITRERARQLERLLLNKIAHAARRLR